MKMFGEQRTKNDLLRHVGRMAQVAGAREVTYRGGRQEGVKAVEVYNDTGLSFTVLPDKSMDIGYASFCGKPLAWLCKKRLRRPAIFRERRLRVLPQLLGRPAIHLRSDERGRGRL